MKRPSIRTADIEAVIARGGGYADRPSLVRAVGRGGVERAEDGGVLRQISRGVYVLAGEDMNAAALAIERGGVLFGLSAAQYHGWELLREPTKVSVAVRHHRTTPPSKKVTLYRRRLTDSEIFEGIVTSPVRTVLDCCALLPTDEALAVTDSALRRESVEADELYAAAAVYPKRQRTVVLRIVMMASGLAANPFESALRLRCIEAGLNARPQVNIQVKSRTFRVDVADERRRVVVEGDSFAHHASPENFAKDCIRYTELVGAGWRVARLPYTAVVDDAAWCEEVLGYLADPSLSVDSEILHEAG